MAVSIAGDGTATYLPAPCGQVQGWAAVRACDAMIKLLGYISTASVRGLGEVLAQKWPPEKIASSRPPSRKPSPNRRGALPSSSNFTVPGETCSAVANICRAVAASSRGPGLVLFGSEFLFNLQCAENEVAVPAGGAAAQPSKAQPTLSRWQRIAESGAGRQELARYGAVHARELLVRGARS